ncbi:MAG: hypothetical protein ACJATE_001980, partial [Bacteroidia bacterium]
DLFICIIQTFAQLQFTIGSGKFLFEKMLTTKLVLQISNVNKCQV